MDRYLAIEGLTAGYRVPVVGPLSLSLTAGEILGVWGPNGSGKSTLLRAVMGSARIFAGRVRRREGIQLGYQPQRPVRLPEMPIRGGELLRTLHADRADCPPRLSGWLHQRIDALSLNQPFGQEWRRFGASSQNPPPKPDSGSEFTTRLAPPD